MAGCARGLFIETEARPSPGTTDPGHILAAWALGICKVKPSRPGLCHGRRGCVQRRESHRRVSETESLRLQEKQSPDLTHQSSLQESPHTLSEPRQAQ